KGTLTFFLDHIDGQGNNDKKYGDQGPGGHIVLYGIWNYFIFVRTRADLFKGDKTLGVKNRLGPIIRYLGMECLVNCQVLIHNDEKYGERGPGGHIVLYGIWNYFIFVRTRADLFKGDKTFGVKNRLGPIIRYLGLECLVNSLGLYFKDHLVYPILYGVFKGHL